MKREDFITLALKEAERAFNEGEVPVGAVLVSGSQVISKAHNKVEAMKDPSAHAEILALREASKKLGRKFLDGTTLYVTLEPCPMCAYALVLWRVSEVVFGALDPKSGGVVSLYNITQDPRLNHRVRWVYLPTEGCSKILSAFFRNRR